MIIYRRHVFQSPEMSLMGSWETAKCKMQNSKCKTLLIRILKCESCKLFFNDSQTIFHLKICLFIFDTIYIILSKEAMTLRIVPYC